MSTRPKTMERKLEEFAQSIIPSKEHINNGKRIADHIFRLLQKRSAYGVDRVKISGSIGKRTAVSDDADFDIIVFVNGQHPLFHAVLTDFGKILKADPTFDIQSINDYCIKLEAEGIPFDLLPATNFVTMYPQPRGSELAKVQAKKTMEHVVLDPRNGSRYGTAVCELTIDFLKQQSNFVKEIIRLAKYWNSRLEIRKFAGKSMMIEMIALQTARNLELNGQRSWVLGLTNFLSSMANFDHIVVKFDKFYMDSEIPSNVKETRPLVLDPVNFYNNLAPRDPSVVNKYKEFAAETLRRLKTTDNLDTIFETQPKEQQKSCNIT